MHFQWYNTWMYSTIVVVLEFVFARVICSYCWWILHQCWSQLTWVASPSQLLWGLCPVFSAAMFPLVTRWIYVIACWVSLEYWYKKPAIYQRCVKDKTVHMFVVINVQLKCVSRCLLSYNVAVMCNLIVTCHFFPWVFFFLSTDTETWNTEW